MMSIPLATGPFFSLNNTDFVVLLGFLIFIGVLVYFKVPALLTGMLDARADKIRSEIDEARSLREEAQALLASFERKQKEVADQAAGIIKAAKAEAETAAEQAREDLERTMARRVRAASDQIASAEKAAVKEVTDTAITVATLAAEKVISERITDGQSDALIDDAIKTVAAKLH